MWAKPAPPKPFLMHLGVTARSHSMDDFLSNSADDLPQHFLYRQTKKKSASSGATDRTSGSKDKRKKQLPNIPSWAELASCTEQEAQLVTDMLSTVIKWVASLPETRQCKSNRVPEAVIRSLAEPIPYFCQFWSPESAKQKHSPGGTSPAATFSPECSPKGGIGSESSEGEEASPAGRSDAPERLSVIMRKEHCREQKEAIMRMPAFVNLTELVLDNTIQNILVEASRGEVVLTARPRIIALPPLSAPKGISPIMSTIHKPSLAQPPAVPLVSFLRETKDCEGQRHIVLPP
ncbi:hypothetical protein JRQ81_001932 [Phrynocephalus forsythii]|uniref:Uncharacterized protein n=1 Tax=Phrynocephalus forsythii TaxID=171643 RepID=A0A9Q0Y8W4_9SAUR|nr:hypothetical protein JRQ81_001932 [Phrynocephalus forsythii]